MIKKWQSFNELNEYIKTSEILSSEQVKIINDKIRTIGNKNLHWEETEDGGFFEVQNSVVCEFITYCEDNVFTSGAAVDLQDTNTISSFNDITVDDIIEQWNKNPQELKTFLRNFIKAPLIYPNIDSELNEILTEFKDEYDFEMTTGCKSDDGLGKTGKAIFYEIKIDDSDVSQFDNIFDCYYFDPSKTIMLMNIIKRIAPKISELGWTCILKDSSQVDLLVMIIYKEID